MAPSDKSDKDKSLSEKLKERAKYAVSQEDGGSVWDKFREATTESFWLGVIALPISIALEQLTNKVLKPVAQKIYRFIKQDPEAEMPEIAQSLFKVSSYFVWFPSVILSHMLRKMVEGPPKNGVLEERVKDEDIANDVPTDSHGQNKNRLSKEQQKLADEAETNQQRGRGQG